MLSEFSRHSLSPMALLGGHLGGSEKGHPKDFTETRIQEALDNELTYIYDFAHWEVVPEERFGDAKFLMELGDLKHNSRILIDREDARSDSEVLEVPEDLRRDFERDMEGSIRDYAGRTTLSELPFIADREKIWAMAERFAAKGWGTPYSIIETDLVDGTLDLIPGY